MRSSGPEEFVTNGSMVNPWPSLSLAHHSKALNPKGRDAYLVCENPPYCLTRSGPLWFASVGVHMKMEGKSTSSLHMVRDRTVRAIHVMTGLSAFPRQSDLVQFSSTHLSPPSVQVLSRSPRPVQRAVKASFGTASLIATKTSTLRLEVCIARPAALHKRTTTSAWPTTSKALPLGHRRRSPSTKSPRLRSVSLLRSGGFSRSA